MWADHLLLAAGDDAGALARLVAEYERYARSLAGRLHRGREPREDLDQIALEALVVALRRFDPGRGLPFPAFATPTILGALRRHYRDNGWLVRVPRRVHEFAGARRNAIERLSSALGRPPTDEELAEALGMTSAEVRAGSAALHARDARSLDVGAGEDATLGDHVGTADPGLAEVEVRLDVAAAIASVGEAGQQLLRWYFVQEQTQTEIADRLGVSQMQVSRLLRRTLEDVRRRAQVA